MESIFLSGYSSSEMNLQYADFCFYSLQGGRDMFLEISKIKKALEKAKVR
jgi:hypothetical protein